MAKRRILTRRSAVDRDVARATRAGMTLIECMVALVILSGSLLALGNFMGKYAHTETMAAASGGALDLATNQIDSIKHYTVYANIPTTFAGSQTITEGSGSKYTRTTSIKHIGGGPTDTLDVMVATVHVTPNDSTGAGVTKTLVIGAF
jgi:prepilin-type N-terminal cleavage/methylation domain-containing protein